MKLHSKDIEELTFMEAGGYVPSKYKSKSEKRVNNLKKIKRRNLSQYNKEYE